MTGIGDVELVDTGVEAFQPAQDEATPALASRNGCDWTVMEMKFGMQTMNVTT